MVGTDGPRKFFKFSPLKGLKRYLFCKLRTFYRYNNVDVNNGYVITFFFIRTSKLDEAFRCLLGETFAK